MFTMKKRNSNTLRKVMAVLLALLMVISMVPIIAFAADPQECQDFSNIPDTNLMQIKTGTGGTAPLYFGDGVSADGTTVAKRTITDALAPDLSISMSKSIAATPVENEFDITLEVTTNSVVQNNPRSDAAVVIVLDVSGSMLKNGTNNIVTYSERRLKKAVDAINKFIEDFSKVTDLDGNPIPGKRYVSIITFGSSGTLTVLRDWKNVGTENGIPLTDLSFAKVEYRNEGNTGKLYGDSSPELDPGQYTWMSGGVSGAIARWTDFVNRGYVVTSKNTILFTDGEPNQNDGSGGTLPAGTYSTLGTNFNWVEARARTLKTTTGSKLFTVAYGSIGHSDWLNEYVCSGKDDYHFAVTGASGTLTLNKMFELINEQINLMANAWTVTDPMGSNIEYVSKQPGNKPGSVTEPGADGKLSWDIKKDEAVETGGIPGNRTQTFRLTYRVRLKTEEIVANDWNGNVSKYFPTNGTTTLTYTFERQGEDKPLVSSSANFLIPQVRGYRADFTFAKKGDGEAAPLDGFTFDLKGIVDNTATSAETTGNVAFRGIPSGYSYVLSERNVVPAKYTGMFNTSDVKYNVVVSYGDVYLFAEADSAHEHVIAHFPKDGSCSSANSFMFVNPRNVGNLVITKTNIGSGSEYTADFKHNGVEDVFTVTVTFTGGEDSLKKLVTANIEIFGADTLSDTPVIPSGSSDFSVACEFTITAAAGDSKTFIDIPVGVTYKVVETNPATTERRYESPVYTVNGSISNPAGAEGTIAAGTAANAVIIGNKLKKGPSLDVEKTITNPKTGGSTAYAPGETIEFNIRVTNDGGYKIKTLTFDDRINGSSGTTTGKAIMTVELLIEGNPVAWTNGSTIEIAPGNYADFRVMYIVVGDEGANALNYVSVTPTYDGDDDDTPDDDDVPFTLLMPDIEVSKVQKGAASPTASGYEVTYEVTVKNKGGAMAYGVTLSDGITNSGATLGEGWKFGTIKAYGIEPTEKIYDKFSDILFNLEAGKTVSFVYTVTYNLNEWDVGSLLSDADKKLLEDFRKAEIAVKDAEAALGIAKKAYEDAVAAADTIVKATKDAMDLAKAALDLVEPDYTAAVNNLEALYLAVSNGKAQYELALEEYAKNYAKYLDPADDSVTVEPVAPVYTDYVNENTAAIEAAVLELEAQRILFDPAFAAYNNAVAAYNAELAKVDHADIDALEDAWKLAKNDFDAAKNTFEGFDKQEFTALQEYPGTHEYLNTASVTYKLTADANTPEGPITAQPENPVEIEAKTTPMLVVDKQVSIDGGNTWQRVASFADANGGTVKFRMTIKNVGSEDLRITSIDDIYDGYGIKEDIMSLLVSGGTFDRVTLAVNQTLTFEWSPEGGMISNLNNYSALLKVNEFSVSYVKEVADPVDPDSEDLIETVKASAIVIVPPDTYAEVTIVKEVKDKEGDWVKFASFESDVAVNAEFRLTLTNTGTKDTTAYLDDGYTYMVYDKDLEKFVPVEGKPVGSINAFEDEGKTKEVTPTVPIKAGETIKLFATISVNPGEYIDNVVTMTYDHPKFGEEGRGEDSAAVTVTPRPKAYLSVEKKVQDLDGVWKDLIEITSSFNQTLLYRITVTNKGTVHGTAVLTDIMENTSAKGTLYPVVDGTIDKANPILDNETVVEVGALSYVVFYYVIENAGVGTYKNVAKLSPFEGSNNEVEIVIPEDDATAIINSPFIPWNPGPGDPDPGDPVPGDPVPGDPEPVNPVEEDPDSEFDNEDPPLADFQPDEEPEEEFIEEVPLGALPTGDTTLVLPLIGLLLSSLGLGILLFGKRKHDYTE